MGMYEGFDGWVDKVSEKVGAPVVGLVAVQPRGSAGGMGAGMALSRISPLASMVVSKAQGNKGNDKAGGLGKISVWQTKSALLAATAEKVYAFEVKQGWGGLKLKDPLFVWDRKDIKITAVAQKMTSAIDVEIISTGEVYEVESMTLGGGGKQIEEFVAELSK